MKERLYDYLISNSSEIGAFKALEILIIALLISLIIFVTYKITYSGVMYNKKFNVSLVMLVLITSMVMIVIGSNIALSLGMVGALSIVRFRTAVKDPRDTMYIFWAISSGICVGTQSYVIALIGTVFLSIVIFALSVGGLGKEDRYILIVRGIREKEEEMMSCVFKAFKSGQLRAKNSTGKNIELVYQIKINKENDKGILKELYAIEGVSTVNIIAQNGETLG
ncbi:DUF4956 domain-containing protein [Clostridium sp. B9]|uniref:DUF4956 domain-containing protein n=1 Tax=Clostridium sp. B9 TaxID=3423224 RepID=UPI003D2F0A0F